MNFRLNSFQFKSSDQKKWSSQVISFANEITSIRGENGAGKTPMMRGMAFALGHKVDLPPDIIENAEFASISFFVNEEKFVLERRLSGDFFISVESSNGVTSYSEERKFSDWLLGRFGIDLKEVTIKGGKAGAKLYIGQVLPLFWVSQSKGWVYTYQPPNTQNFIYAQREEAVRSIFNLPPRHPFDKNRAYEEKKKELKATEELIEIRRLSLNKMRQSIEPLVGKTIQEIEESINSTKIQIEAARGQLESASQSTLYLDEQIDGHRRKQYELNTVKSEILGRIRGLEIAYGELDTETEILESNELATDAFRAFCGLSNCKAFEDSKQSYGKRLLYLRDQLKDIKNSKNSLSLHAENLKQEIEKEQQTIPSLEQKRVSALKTQGAAGALESIERLSREYSKLQTDLETAKRYSDLKASFGDLITERAVLDDAVKELKPGGGRSDKTRLYDVMEVFRTSILEWLKILNTPNIGSLEPITVNEDFSISCRGEVFSEDSFQDGSTRARIVLAHYAAYLETSMQVSGHHPGILFLDTPKQQEINSTDLKAYFEQMRQLIRRRAPSAQVVLACKDEIIASEIQDKEFWPTFRINGELRYLGSQSN